MEDRGRGSASSDFAVLLRRYRLAEGLSQEALAERARLSLYGISALERGYRRVPQRETIALLARALALNDNDRSAFEAAALRAKSPRLSAGTSVTAGPWPSAGSAKLPLSLTRFVGRKAELDEIAALIAENRLVTLAGAGGIGKTQTALRAAEAATNAAGTTLCFISLAPISDPSLIATAIANVLGVQEVPNHPLIETLHAFLKNKTMLLLLDNCEHMIAKAAAVADSLLHACPNLQILATSREPLRVAGERTYRLSSLNENDAVALFADRAQSTDPHFTLSGDNRLLVREICARLCAIPLAIELAAAQLAVLPLRSLAKALDDRFSILVLGERTAPPRQQTMRAAIDWSYELLNRSEQRLFERLSIFSGGCTIAAVTAICTGGDVAPDDVFTLIASLVSKSLVIMDPEGHEPRYRLLEPFREYAREKLKLRSDEGAVAQRHLLSYLDLAEQFGSPEARDGPYYGHAYDEIGNWRAAVRWGLDEHNDVISAQRLVAVIVRAWGGLGGVLSDARRWIPTAIELINGETPPDVVAELWLAEAYLAMHLDNQKLQLSSAKKAIEYYRRVDDELNLMRALMTAGNALYDLGHINEGRAMLEEALGIARRAKHRWFIAKILHNLGACLDFSDTVASRAYLTEALQGFKALDDHPEMEATAMDFACVAFNEGDCESAVRHIAELFADGRQLHFSRRLIVLAQVSIARYLIALARYEEAQDYSREALEAARAEHFDVHEATALGRLATIAALRTPNAHEGSARILGFVAARLTALGSAAGDFDPALTTLREAIGAACLAKLMAEGAGMTEEDAVETATSL